MVSGTGNGSACVRVALFTVNAVPCACDAELCVSESVVPFAPNRKIPDDA